LGFGFEGIDLYGTLEQVEDCLIARALWLAGGNKKEAARLLRVNRTTLLEKLKRKDAAGRAVAGQTAGTPAWEKGESPDEAPAVAAPTPTLSNGRDSA
jgi:hypothetical protein